MGTVWLSAGAFAIGGMRADGRILAINSNTALFSLLGTKFGGDGMNTFALPDLRALEPTGLYYTICVSGYYPSRA
jgi:microcystin-dependent protein